MHWQPKRYAFFIFNAMEIKALNMRRMTIFATL